MGDYKKYAKPIMVKIDVYNDLKIYKDENNFPSFTEAIRNLLKIEHSWDIKDYNVQISYSWR